MSCCVHTIAGLVSCGVLLPQLRQRGVFSRLAHRHPALCPPSQAELLDKEKKLAIGVRNQARNLEPDGSLRRQLTERCRFTAFPPRKPRTCPPSLCR